MQKSRKALSRSCEKSWNSAFSLRTNATSEDLQKKGEVLRL